MPRDGCNGLPPASVLNAPRCGPTRGTGDGGRANFEQRDYYWRSVRMNRLLGLIGIAGVLGGVGMFGATAVAQPIKIGSFISVTQRGNAGDRAEIRHQDRCR